MLFPMAEYRPDVADLNSAFTDTVKNVLCSAGAYIPAPSLLPALAALPGVPLGSLAVKGLDGTVRTFAGTATDLYVFDPSTMNWLNVSKVAGDYSASVDSPWCLKAFGDFVIAVNGANANQVFQIGVDTKFRDLGGSPPVASYVAIWGDFVALMGLTSNPNRVQWSGLNNCEFWTPGSNNSDYQDFADGGVVQGSSETTNPIIFLESAIFLGTFIPGSVVIFSFLKIQDKRGAFSRSSIATRGSMTFYCDIGGFYQIAADGSITPIGFEKVDRSIFSKVSAISLSRMRGVVDPYYSRVYWAYDAIDQGNFTHLIVFDWQLGAWSQIEVAILDILSFALPGYTLEQLDTFSASIEGLPYSLDSRFWQGSAPLIGAFSLENRLGAFSGPAMEATVVTQEVGNADGSLTRTSASNPIVDTANVWVSIGVRNRRSDAVTWLPEQTRSSNSDLVRKRSRARYHRMKVRVQAGAVWSRMSGVDVQADDAGKR